jgi:hypothetical protein
MKSFSLIDLVIPENSTQFLAPIFGIGATGFWYIVHLFMPRLDITSLNVVVTSVIFFIMIRMSIVKADHHLTAEARAVVLFVFLSLFVSTAFDTFDLGISAEFQEYVFETWRYFVIFTALGLLWMGAMNIIKNK